MTIPWVTVGKYSAVALSSSCFAVGVCFATHNQKEEDKREELQVDSVPSPEEIRDEPANTEQAQVTIEKLNKKVKDFGAKNFAYFLRDDCYVKEEKRLKAARAYNSTTYFWQKKQDETPRYGNCRTTHPIPESA